MSSTQSHTQPLPCLSRRYLPEDGWFAQGRHGQAGEACTPWAMSAIGLVTRAD